jgi:putative transposase
MARPLRMESDGGVYHLINRGNYRADIFRSEKTKAAFLKCLGETCTRTDWRVHAWCLMTNHYHLAVSTPQANLVEGMRWMQGTFAIRFNRLREERGHLFQGRYKSLVVDPDGGLGPLCHYIHLNPVRARLCPPESLRTYRWTSVSWLANPATRPSWYDPVPALRHAGSLADNLAGRRQYLAYLAWLAEDEPARKQLRFEHMSKGWIVGTEDFTKELLREQRELRGRGPRLAAELSAAREAIWQDELTEALRKIDRKACELAATGKSVEWKIALAAALKARTTVTNRWLATHLALGSRYEVGRKVAAWLRQPTAPLFRQLGLSPRPTA